ncbi:hypothetical protein [Azospirillum sp.]|uniref:hypothetical protein n=1 Tax=Azospirillum sp. TaxID=34012 RepID=UPI003D7301FA
MSAPDWTKSDKHFWHQYIDTYRQAFQTLGPVRNILEYGIFRGDSLRWLRDEFPGAAIIGADILEPLDTWPREEGIRYVRLDQSDRAQVRLALEDAGVAFDLVIEDGSHVPQHQALCLAETLPHLRSGGLYILEDIHTSHPEHPYYQQTCAGYPAPPATCLHVLLALQHLRATDARLTDRVAAQLASPDFFTVDEVHTLYRSIASVELYKRTRLPLYCASCGGSQYDYVAMRCACGAPIFHSADSMSFLIRKA